MSADLHWRNTMKPARFFALDARAAAPFFVVLLHARNWTFAVAIIVIIVFVVAERRGLTFEAAIRALRSWIVGNRRPAVIFTDKRRMTEYLS
ncbi:MAG TPA: type IV secretion protein IcmT [Rhodospirillaceae bacterium]|nr:MAG: type IV secretion protein IcmT [Alphaproteobacteria bacterium GWF2_58_20]HAU29985.1 type IV secretion protein IcmT [Rhodospirillaceae bacterium]